MNRLLVPTDGSPAAEAAVEAAVKLAEERGDEVVFLHVVDAIDVHVLRFTQSEATPEPLDHPTMSDPLEHAAKVAHEHAVPCELRLASGFDVDVILETADEIDAELIAVGSNRRGPIGTALRGSVSRELLKRARRPVLLVDPTCVPAEMALAN